MNCSDAQELLSAYYDEELGDDQRRQLSNHLAECANCTRDLAGFSALTGLAGRLSTPVLPEQGWNQLEQRLAQQRTGDQTPSRPVDPIRRLPVPVLRVAAWAATILVAVAVSWLVYHPSWSGHRQHEQFAEDFGHYLETFRRDPDTAQQILLARYDSQLVHPNEAIERVGFRPAVAGGLPAAYTLESTRVMQMPCCMCVQSICRRSDGSALAIFEHGDCSCGDEECCLTTQRDQIAACWKRGIRHMTLIGARDATEVKNMVTWLDRTK